MLKRFLGIAVISSLLWACGVNKNIRLGEEVLTYNSAGNDIANIYLAFYDNHRFLFEIKPVDPEMETEAQRKEVGTFTEEGSWYLLQFPKKSNFELKAIFEGEQDADWFEIIDTHQVRIRKNMDAFYLWGILVERQ